MFTATRDESNDPPDTHSTAPAIITLEDMPRSEHPGDRQRFPRRNMLSKRPVSIYLDYLVHGQRKS